ncbi:MAG: VIT1/CCC1 transporter family protein [Nitrososphaerales archaeon]
MSNPKRDSNENISSRKLPNSAPIKEVHRHIPGRGLISSVALGISDGLVTNLAFLAGFAGSISDLNLVRFAGSAAMLAGAASMFFGALLAARSELDLFKADKRREEYEIDHEPDEERQELRKFYVDKGLTPEEADTVIKRVTSDKQKWLEDLLIHELHLHETVLENPYKVAVVTGISFLLGAFVPLISYLLSPNQSEAILGSFSLSFLFLFIAGAWKGRLASRKPWRAGLEMLCVGAVAAIALYVIGRLLIFA